MRINAGFFANHAEIVDEMLNVSGGCWNSTTVPPGSAGFRCRCVILCDVRRQDRAARRSHCTSTLLAQQGVNGFPPERCTSP